MFMYIYGIGVEKQQVYRDMASSTGAQDTGSGSASIAGIENGAKNNKIDKKKKAVVVKLSRNPSGYQIYSSEVMKTGVKMNDVAASWRLLDEAAKQVFKDKAIVK